MSVTANQVTPAIKTWRERLEGCQHSPGLVAYSMHEEIAELRAALAAFETRELVAYCERIESVWVAYDPSSITAEFIRQHQPERIGVDILPVYQARKS